MAGKKRKHPKHWWRWHVNCLQKWLGVNRVATTVKHVATLVAWLALLALPFFRQAESFDPQKFPSLWWIAAWKTPTILVLLVTQACCQIIIWLLSLFEQRNLKQIHKALDSIAGSHFPGVDLNRYKTRATLFKRRSFPGLGSWLGVVDRSGENYRRMKSIFSVNDDVESENTGVAGVCYWRGYTVVKVVDPIEGPEDAESGEIPQLADPASVDEGCKVYKDKTFLTDDEYDCLSMKSCVFFATCIKIDGKKWGVLVLDTTDRNAAPGEKQKKQRTLHLEHATELLSTLLK